MHAHDCEFFLDVVAPWIAKNKFEKSLVDYCLLLSTAGTTATSQQTREYTIKLLPYAEPAQFATLNVLEKVLLLSALKFASSFGFVEDKELPNKLKQLARCMRDKSTKMKDETRN